MSKVSNLFSIKFPPLSDKEIVRRNTLTSPQFRFNQKKKKKKKNCGQLLKKEKKFFEKKTGSRRKASQKRSLEKR